MFYKHTPSLQLAFHPIKQSHFFSTLHRLRRRYATASVSQELNDKKKRKEEKKEENYCFFNSTQKETVGKEKETVKTPTAI